MQVSTEIKIKSPAASCNCTETPLQRYLCTATMETGAANAWVRPLGFLLPSEIRLRCESICAVLLLLQLEAAICGNIWEHIDMEKWHVPAVAKFWDSVEH